MPANSKLTLLCSKLLLISRGRNKLFSTWESYVEKGVYIFLTLAVKPTALKWESKTRATNAVRSAIKQKALSLYKASAFYAAAL